MIMDKQSLSSDLKKLKALSGAIIRRFPSKKVQIWAEMNAIFQRTQPVSFNDINFDHDADLVSLKRAFKQGRLKEVDIVNQQGDIKLHAWFLQPQDNMPTVIYSYGNSGNLSEGKYLMSSFARRGFGFVGWSYPGYEYSEGYPSEQGLCDGLKAISDYLIFTHGIQPSDQIAVGHSLGGLVSVDAAMEISFRMLVLMATPPSIPDYYDNLLKSIPSLIRWMCIPKEKITQHFDALSKMQFVKSPVLFIYAEKDEEIPLDMARKLFSLSRTLNHEQLIKGAGHDFEEIPEFAEEICKTVYFYQNHQCDPDRT